MQIFEARGFLKDVAFPSFFSPLCLSLYTSIFHSNLRTQKEPTVGTALVSPLGSPRCSLGPEGLWSQLVSPQVSCTTTTYSSPRSCCCFRPLSRDRLRASDFAQEGSVEIIWSPPPSSGLRIKSPRGHLAWPRYSQGLGPLGGPWGPRAPPPTTPEDWESVLGPALPPPPVPEAPVSPLPIVPFQCVSQGRGVASG